LNAPSRAAIAVALGLVYVVWGSTYLGIRFAVETIPPFLMGGTRFFLAGVILYATTRLRGAAKPVPRDWVTSAIVGFCLIFCGNGGLSYAEQYLDSGLSALLVATVPLWMMLGGWLLGMTSRPRPLAWIALAVGFVGVMLIARPGTEEMTPHRGMAVGLILCAALVWAAGSLYAKQTHPASSPFLLAGMQMICGGLFFFLAGLGEWHGFSFAQVGARAMWAVVYLTFVGSLVGFTAYIWVLRAASPALVGTYAFVNPLVALLLGALWGAERITPQIAGGAALIVAAVAVLLVSDQRKRPV
jgi:drug/metabolite transporter (DMT)-like permease